MTRLPWFLGNPQTQSSIWTVPFLFLIIWSAVFTGLALWHAARRGEKGWFVFFLVVHTAGIIEIVYLMFVARAFSRKFAGKK